ncbi:SPOR domain-containing protein [Afifella sp. YEN Y35]|uniref:SPOR domain-containing protein n=1 Tax=Afifella sp. YEN Y35 TaxID=3388337 RepID=UPI0039E05360
MAFASAASGISSGDSAQAAILAVSAPANRPAAPRQIASGYDPIAARIEEATEVARLAYASDAAGEDPIAALTRMADRRAAALGEPALHAAEGAADEEPLVSVRTRRGYSEPRLAPGGWHIQIGATPSEEGARTLLDKAKRNGGTVLASATPFTQPVEKSGETLYRARFAGFSGKNEARAACASLKRKSFSCLALPN